jgi:hypothetical protein
MRMAGERQILREGLNVPVSDVHALAAKSPPARRRLSCRPINFSERAGSFEATALARSPDHPNQLEPAYKNGV